MVTAVGAAVLPSTDGVSVGAPDCAGTTTPPTQHRLLPTSMLSDSGEIDTIASQAEVGFSPPGEIAADPCWDKGTSNAASDVGSASLSLPDLSEVSSTHSPYPYLKLYPFGNLVTEL